MKSFDFSASNLNSTALLVLLTCCPPGPEAFINCSLNSQLFIVTFSSIFSIFGIYHFYFLKNTKKGRSGRAAFQDFSEMGRLGGSPIKSFAFSGLP
jgi:hypothetical protein